jgi:acetyltransferase-like isoleucine patch superfamily enzyme
MRKGQNRDGHDIFAPEAVKRWSVWLGRLQSVCESTDAMAVGRGRFERTARVARGLPGLIRAVGAEKMVVEAPKQKSVRVHPDARIEPDVEIGDGTSIWDHAHIRPCTAIGEQCIVGEKTCIANAVKIGNRVKIDPFKSETRNPKEIQKLKCK